jgi:hypothetical protein
MKAASILRKIRRLLRDPLDRTDAESASLSRSGESIRLISWCSIVIPRASRRYWQ